ncbi:MAG: ribose-phosphate pyrophosphokinase, partial [SAR324 cluster bacterium]|nr:ribose-phosphate pyrophosphokinase [SAR324 cluster bacterium]
MSNDSIVVSNWTDASFGLDVAYKFGQQIDVSDLISLKTFANSEFCPRFLGDETNPADLGRGLAGPRVYPIPT